MTERRHDGRRRARRALLVAAVAWAVLTGDTIARAARSARRADKALDAALSALVTMPGGPRGAIALVQRGSRLTVHAFGVADVRRPDAIRSDDHMRVASVSKAFNGATALVLVSRGILSLDDTIGRRLPRLPQAWAAVTLRQLLSHTSGLPDYLSVPSAQRAIADAPAKAPPPDRLLDFVAGLPLRFPPGSAYRYSNSDNVTVGLMIEAVTGASYERALQDDVLGPLGLGETTLPSGARMPMPYVHGYDEPTTGPPEDVSEDLASGWAWASGGIVSTPVDLNTFIRGYLGLQLFRGPTRAAQRKFVRGGASDPPGPGTNAAGLGIFRYRTRCGTVFGHTGNYPGYTQFAAASRDGRRSVTVSVSVQLRPDLNATVFDALQHGELLAVCAALAGRG